MNKTSLVCLTLAATLLVSPAAAQEDDPDAAVAAEDLRSASTVLFWDDFDDVSVAKLLLERNASQILEYVGGEYRIARLEPGGSSVTIPIGPQADFEIAFDGRLVGPAGIMQAIARRQSDQDSDYRLVVQDGSRTASIRRRDDGVETTLAQLDLQNDLVAYDDTNRWVFRLVAENVSFSVNGKVAAVVGDAAYQAGSLQMAVFLEDEIVEASFDNLMVTQLNANEPPPKVDVGGPIDLIPGTTLIVVSSTSPQAHRGGDPASAEGWLYFAQPFVVKDEGPVVFTGAMTVVNDQPDAQSKFGAGLVFQNEQWPTPNFRKFNLRYRAGRWELEREAGSPTTTRTLLTFGRSIPRTNVQFTFTLDNNGQTGTIVINGNQKPFDLGDSLYAGGERSIRPVMLSAEQSGVTIHSLTASRS